MQEGARFLHRRTSSGNASKGHIQKIAILKQKKEGTESARAKTQQIWRLVARILHSPPLRGAYADINRNPSPDLN